MKMNTLSIQQQENQFKRDLDYEEYLRDNNPEPTSDEVEKMHKVFCSSVILKKSSFHPIKIGRAHV